MRKIHFQRYVSEDKFEGSGREGGGGARLALHLVIGLVAPAARAPAPPRGLFGLRGPGADPPLSGGLRPGPAHGIACEGHPRPPESGGRGGAGRGGAGLRCVPSRRKRASLRTRAGTRSSKPAGSADAHQHPPPTVSPTAFPSVRHPRAGRGCRHCTHLGRPHLPLQELPVVGRHRQKPARARGGTGQTPKVMTTFGQNLRPLLAKSRREPDEGNKRCPFPPAQPVQPHAPALPPRGRRSGSRGGPARLTSPRRPAARAAGWSAWGAHGARSGARQHAQQRQHWSKPVKGQMRRHIVGGGAGAGRGPAGMSVAGRRARAACLCSPPAPAAPLSAPRARPHARTGPRTSAKRCGCAGTGRPRRRPRPTPCPRGRRRAAAAAPPARLRLPPRARGARRVQRAVRDAARPLPGPVTASMRAAGRGGGRAPRRTRLLLLPSVGGPGVEELPSPAPSRAVSARVPPGAVACGRAGETGRHCRAAVPFRLRCRPWRRQRRVPPECRTSGLARLRSAAPRSSVRAATCRATCGREALLARGAHRG